MTSASKSSTSNGAAAAPKPTTSGQHSRKASEPTSAQTPSSRLTSRPTSRPASSGTGTPSRCSCACDRPDSREDELANVNNELPSLELIRQIDNYQVLDQDGKAHSFRSLYTGKHVARRVLIIFVRHFFCGNCQNYLRTLSASITSEALLSLPLTTFICVVGCGDPSLIKMYADATGCPFPIYTDPSRRLYEALGMGRTLALGERPAYMQQHLLVSSAASVLQSLKQLGKGKVHKGGDAKQVGGEFLFEPKSLVDAVRKNGNVLGAVASPVEGLPRDVLFSQPGDEMKKGGGERPGSRREEASLDGKFEPDGDGEDKVVTWCHRMRNTRDHAEIPELMEVLGLEGYGQPSEDEERWRKALITRKGKGMSLAGQMGLIKGLRTGEWKDENGVKKKEDVVTKESETVPLNEKAEKASA